MTLDDLVQLHEEIRIVYVVDRYQAELTTDDGDRLVAVARGLTLQHALRVLEDECRERGLDSVEAVRAAPAVFP